MVECHYGVAASGGVLNTINTRLDAATIAYILEHGEARVLISDIAFARTISAALEMLGPDHGITVIDIVDMKEDDGTRLGSMDYESLLKAAMPKPNGACQMMSGMPWRSTILRPSGKPKGVVIITAARCR